MKLLYTLRIPVFRSSEHANRFMAEVFKLLQSPSASAEEFERLINSCPHCFRFRSSSAVLTECGCRFSLYKAQDARLLFRYLSVIPDHLHPAILQHNIKKSDSPEIIRHILQSYPDITGRIAARRILTRLKKAASPSEKRTWFSVSERLPETEKIRVYEFVFSQSFRDHRIRMLAVAGFSGLNDASKIRLTLKIAKLKETDETILTEAMKQCAGADPNLLHRLISVLLQSAPSDLTALKTIELISSLDRNYRDSSLIRKAADSLRRTLKTGDKTLFPHSVRLISAFDHIFRKDLILDAIRSGKGDAAADALRYSVLLSNELRKEVISEAISVSSVKSENESVFLRAVRMIRLLPAGDRSYPAVQAAEKLIRELKYIESNSHYCNAVHILAALRDLNIYRDLIPASLMEKAVKTGAVTLKLLLADSRKSHQTAALSVLPDFLNEIQYLPDVTENLTDLMFESAHEEVITEAGRIIPLLPESLRSAALSRYFRALTVKGIVHELRKYSSETVYNNIRFFEDSPSLLYRLSGLPIFSMRETAALLSEAVADKCGLPQNLISKAGKHIRSDKELILFLHDFIYSKFSVLSMFSSREIRILCRLILQRHRIQEKGFTQDCTAITDDIVSGKISLLSDYRNLASFFREPDIRSYDYQIYSAWSEASAEDKKKIPEFIRSIPVKIIRGESSRNLRKEIKNLLKHPEESENDTLFSFLMQVLPIQSAHLSRSEAFRIFMESLRTENAVLSDINTFCRSAAGFSVTRPSWKTVLTAERTLNPVRMNSFFSEIRSLAERNRSSGGDIIPAAESPDLITFRERILRFLINASGDSLSAAASMFRTEGTELLESASRLHDYLNFTGKDIFTKSLQDMRHRMGRMDYYRRIRNLITILNLNQEIPEGFYLGNMKPSAAVRFIKSFGESAEIFSVLRICRLYTEKEVLLAGSDVRRILTWEKLLRLLRRPGSWQDQALAEAVESHLASLDSTENIRKTGKLISFDSKYLYTILWKRVLGALWADLLEECRDTVSAFSQTGSVPGPDITYSAGKSAYLSVYGGLSDICIAKDMKLFSRDHFTLLSMVQKDRFTGFCLLHSVKEAGERILVLAGCEPSAAFAASYSPAFIYTEVIQVLKEMKRKCGFDRLVQIDDENAFSNREVIRNYIKKEIASVKPSGFLKKNLYLGSYGITSFRSQRYYILD